MLVLKKEREKKKEKKNENKLIYNCKCVNNMKMNDLQQIIKLHL